MILGLLVLGVGGIYPALTLATGLPTKYNSLVLVSYVISCSQAELEKGCEEGGGHGSGVIIGRNTVVTAKHVASEGVLTVVDQKGKKHTVTKSVLNKTEDIAILTVKEPFVTRPVAVRCTVVKPLEKLYGVGYPLDFGAVIFELTAVDYYEDEADGRVLTATGVSLPGNSGGPVYDTSGRLIGILVAEYLYTTGDAIVDSDMNIIVPIKDHLCGRPIENA
jgi:S1-C subfamily serine protease